MATLDPYFGKHTGACKIYVGSFAIGSGNFKSFSPVQVDFDGSYQVFGTAGKFAIEIKLVNNNPGSTSGPCEITLNGQTDKAAKYQVNGQKLTFTTTLNPTPFDVYASNGGTQVDNVSGHNLWIG
jgi:hypothetical protein